MIKSQYIQLASFQFQSESPTLSGVNGLGIYLLCSLGLVFFALIEFAMIITLKRKKEGLKISPKKDRKIRKTSKKLVRQLKIVKNLCDTEEGQDKKKGDSETELFQKIDYRSFIGYFVIYLLFNFFYWIDMIC